MSVFRPLEVLRALNDHDVEYVLIGGYAAAIRGSPLATNDADICPSASPENLARLARALSDLDARIAIPDDDVGVEFPHDPEFIGRVRIWNLTTRFGKLDLSFRPSGTEGYTDLARAATLMDLDDGLIIPVASLLDIIRSKQAANRDKDQRALPTLRQLLEVQTDIDRDPP